MKGGYTGKILDVDLSSGAIKKVDLKPEIARKFIGGRGLGAWYLWSRTKEREDPLGPENVICLMAGPLTGLPMGRTTLVSKNPLTGGIAHTTAGGDFHPELKFAGYDGVIITGRAEELVYISIIDEEVEIRDASPIQGLDTHNTFEKIKKLHDDPFIKSICIGPAGEKQVRYACVSTEYWCTYGRSGLGAVFGSKKLKAIAVRGTRGFPIIDKAKLMEAYNLWMDFLKKQAAGERSIRSRFQEPYLATIFGNIGQQGVRNNQEAYAPKAWQLGSFNHDLKHWVRHWSCFGCPIHDRQIGIVRYGPYAGTMAKGPSYEPTSGLGALCGIFEPEAVMYLVELADKLGFDCVGLGRVVAFAMELYEKNILKEEDFDGIKLEWGDPKAGEELIKKICNREGIGDLLAEGVKRASERIGGDAPKYALHIKGQEAIGRDWRAVLETAIGEATANRGADHLQGTTPEEQFSAALVDSLCLCFYHSVFHGYYQHLGLYSKILNLVTGWSTSPEELMTIGERIWNLEKCFNVREGMTRKDDMVPDRVFDDPVPSGPTKGATLDRGTFAERLDKYYEKRGWDKNTGIPTREKLIELGLDEIEKEISQKRK
jgi:aldehyde:ferredoxin oxidoreductase